jgi:hypothetical protein
MFHVGRYEEGDQESNVRGSYQRLSSMCTAVFLIIKQSFGYARFLRGKRAGDDVMVKMG